MGERDKTEWKDKNEGERDNVKGSQNEINYYYPIILYFISNYKMNWICEIYGLKYSFYKIKLFLKITVRVTIKVLLIEYKILCSHS